MPAITLMTNVTTKRSRPTANRVLYVSEPGVLSPVAVWAMKPVMVWPASVGFVTIRACVPAARATIIVSPTARERARTIDAVMPEMAAGNTTRKVVRMVLAPRAYEPSRRDRGTALKEAGELLERVGLGARIDHRPGELSGGEAQRVALARALVLKPSLLLADEPTGNLDPTTGEGIHQLLRDVNRELGITAVVVTHNEALARSMPRQLRLAGGQVSPA